ncbi:family 43 glycosylhydrolase [Alteromonas gilva]|uniref:Family 43 glycosylhydrolase n=1 Tax=Alteromonas gilva TaxID=2987522 RepID=A0ABT5L0M4_9ALTE|nr:family 43 glycosylhydrolase [Alteromonas gilva]MDC8830581.1 family 43 glycosylhydrolase [Alteromonas gilva]
MLRKLTQSLCLVCVLAANAAVAVTLSGTTDIHDPSTIMREDGVYWTFGTGGGAATLPINALYSTDMVNWSRGPSPVTPNTYPSWINNKVPGFDGNFWAPDIIEMKGKFYLYYSAFSDSQGMHSAIGVMVTDSLNNPNWQDLGMVVSTVDEPNSPQGFPVNAIDAGLYRDTAGNVWMTYGSHYAGLFIRQINPDTGLLLNNTRYNAVGNNGDWNEFEAPQVQYLDGYYYMFANLADCCAGINSNYYVVMGRSTSPTGPFLDKNGVDMWNYGGTTVLSTDGTYIGPGHFGYLRHGTQDLATIHYYDGTTSTGWPARLDVLKINFGNDGWPQFSRNFNFSGDTRLRDGRVSITSVLSGRAMEVSAAGTTDGDNVVQWGYWGGTNQQWDITHIGGGYYTIVNANSGKSLDVFEMSTENGANIAQWALWGGAGQQWQLQYVGNGQYAIRSYLSDLALDVYNMSTADGTNIVQWSYWGGNGQRWTINYVD